jgi:branched-chain amino acid transport system permease protein
VSLVFDALLSGILAGGVYALMASGLTLIFGVLDIVNVAHGIMVVLGSYLSYALSQSYHIDIFLSLFLTMPVMFLLGIAIEWAFVRRLKHTTGRVMLSVLVMFAVALIIEGVLNIAFTPNQISLQASYVDASFAVAGFYLPYVQVFAFLLCVILLFALYMLVYRTNFGYSLRASMQNRTAAALIGVDVEKVSMITFGIGVALAAAGGVAYGATTVFNAASSYNLVSQLLVIIVLGGMGSLRGAFFASLIMMIVSDLTAALWGAQWANTVFFVLLVVLLVFRPQGLFGLSGGRSQ